jgi:uncharacterized protein DUF5666
MRATVRLAIGVAMMTGTIGVAACGGGGSSKSSASPTAPGAAAPSSAAGATITGTVVGGLGAASFRPASAGLTVTIAGSSVTTTVDGGGAFTLHGVPSGNIQVVFNGAGVSAHIDLDDVADHEDIHLTVRVNGTTAEVEDNHREKPDNRAEVEGLVAEVSASARTLRIGDTVVAVPAGVTIRHGGTPLTLAQILVGDRVHVHGTRNGTGVVATEVEVENEHPGDDHGNDPGDDHGNDPGDGHDAAELNGAMSAKAGACPLLTFSVSSTRVTTTSATSFKDTTCGALANGDTVEVKGAKQADGSVLASRVEKKR